MLQLYFPSKLGLVLAYSADASERLRLACVDRRPGDSVLDVLRRSMITEAVEHRDRVTRHAAILAANPVLRGSETSAITAARHAVTAEFTSDLGRPADDPAIVLASPQLNGTCRVLTDPPALLLAPFAPHRKRIYVIGTIVETLFLLIPTIGVQAGWIPPVIEVDIVANILLAR